MNVKQASKQSADAGYDLEDVAEHYKELIQDEATAIMKQKQHNELKTQIQKDLDNLAVIDRNNTIVFPLELAGRTYKVGDKKRVLSGNFTKETRTTQQSQQTT